MNRSRRRTLALAITVWLGGNPGVVSAADDSGTDLPDVQVGDWWSYRRMNVQRNVWLLDHRSEVTFVGPDVIMGTSRNLSRTGEQDVSWTRDWNPMADNNRVFDPVPRFFAFPMKPGQARKMEFRWRIKRAVGELQTLFRLEVRVDGWEDIKVPAGSFRALRIRAEGTFQREDANFAGRAWFDYWYVPEVRNWVKRQYRDMANLGSWSESDELLSYELK